MLSPSSFYPPAMSLVSTSVGRVLIKSVPVATGIRPIRSNLAGMATGMTCALVFWHRWNSIPVQCQMKLMGAFTYARIDTHGYLASPSLRYAAVTGLGYDMCILDTWHGYLLSAVPVRNNTGIAPRVFCVSNTRGTRELLHGLPSTHRFGTLIYE